MSGEVLSGAKAHLLIRTRSKDLWSQVVYLAQVATDAEDEAEALTRRLICTASWTRGGLETSWRAYGQVDGENEGAEKHQAVE